MDTLTLDRPVLFIEFFVREFMFTGKSTVRTELPKDAFFYTGASKADPCFDKNVRGKTVRTPLSKEAYLGFKDHKACLSTQTPSELITKLFTPATNVICVVGSEFSVYGDGYRPEFVGQWHRNNTKVLANKYSGDVPGLTYAAVNGITPYGLTLDQVDADGTAWTYFPYKQVLLSLVPNQTLCFLYRKVEFSYGDYYEPNLNLVLFVKNHGFQSTLAYQSPEVLAGMDSANLCRETFSIRDFRK